MHIFKPKANRKALGKVCLVFLSPSPIFILFLPASKEAER